MEKLIKHAMIAWNPMGEVSRRLEKGILDVSSVLAPFLAVIIGCNILVVGAQKFFMESISYVSGVDVPTDHPLINSDFALQFLSTIGVIVPILFVSILPRSVFNPVGKNATLASLFIVIAGWAFYGAILGAPQYFISGTLVLSDLQTGMNIFVILSTLVSIVVVGLTLWFWFSVLSSRLQLNRGSVALITVAYGVGLAALVILFMLVIE